MIFLQFQSLIFVVFFKSLLIIPKYFSSVKISIDVIISLLTLNKILFSIAKENEKKIIEKKLQQ